MTDKEAKLRVKQLTGKPGRPKGVEIKGSKQMDKGPTILSEHGKHPEIKSTIGEPDDDNSDQRRN